MDFYHSVQKEMHNKKANITVNSLDMEINLSTKLKEN